jgi:hypothetical protein
VKKIVLDYQFCNEIFKGLEIDVALLPNNIPISYTKDRYNIIRELIKQQLEDTEK